MSNHPYFMLSISRIGIRTPEKMTNVIPKERSNPGRLLGTRTYFSSFQGSPSAPLRINSATEESKSWAIKSLSHRPFLGWLRCRFICCFRVVGRINGAAARRRRSVPAGLGPSPGRSPAPPQLHLRVVSRAPQPVPGEVDVPTGVQDVGADGVITVVATAITP